jgi:hypothetical protein
MKNSKILSAIFLGSFMFGSQVYCETVTFEKGLKQFEKRAQGFAFIESGFNTYKKLRETPSTPDDKKMFATVQMARLALSGIQIDKVKSDEQTTVAQQIKLLDECIAATSSLEDPLSKDRGFQEYQYSRLLCLGARAKTCDAEFQGSSNIFSKLADSVEVKICKGRYVSMLNKIETSALQLTRASDGSYVGGFEGGGILRVLSGVRSNPAAGFFGLYKPSDAVKFSTVALNTSLRTAEPYGPLSGKDYFENFFYQGYAYASLAVEQQTPENLEIGKKVVTEAIAMFDSLRDADELPKGRTLENEFYRIKLGDLLEAYTKSGTDYSALNEALSKL